MSVSEILCAVILSFVFTRKMGRLQSVWKRGTIKGSSVEQSVLWYIILYKTVLNGTLVI